MVVDLFLVYQFIRRLATPFEKWDAYKEGVIDKDGKILVKKNKRGVAQKIAFGMFDVMVLNMKKLLCKLPGGSSKIASYAAALFLIKEYKVFTDDSILNEEMDEEVLSEHLSLFNNTYIDYTVLSEKVNKKINIAPELPEEAPANSVGSGGIAGMDGGHMSKAGQKRWTAGNKSDKKKRLRDIMGDKI